tara:strand:- start:11311 stop:11721 length:411 start_codon:yes stop_codon:yes gene_type:complete
VKIKTSLQWPPANDQQTMMLSRAVDTLRGLGMNYHDCRVLISAVVQVNIEPAEWEQVMIKVDNLDQTIDDERGDHLIQLEQLFDRKAYHVVASAVVVSENDPEEWSHDALMEEFCSYNSTVLFKSYPLAPKPKGST